MYKKKMNEQDTLYAIIIALEERYGEAVSPVLDMKKAVSKEMPIQSLQLICGGMLCQAFINRWDEDRENAIACDPPDDTPPLRHRHVRP
jgi:predicted ATP-dependent Lon-type protease